MSTFSERHGPRRQLVVIRPKPAKTGRPREHALREVVNAILYLTKTGETMVYLAVCFACWPNAPMNMPASFSGKSAYKSA